MSKPKSIQIIIPHPCSQNWDDMTPQQQGRFCDHCRKTVIDFTTWSDTALYNFFSKNNDHVCGRFLSSQVNRPINIPYQPQSRLYRITIALGLTLLLGQAPHLLAQSRPPQTEQTQTKGNAIPKQVGWTELRGQVIDDKKEPMINATVMVFQNGTEKGGTVTDYDGNYVIKPLDPGTYDVMVLYAGYDSIKITGVPVISQEVTTQNFQMAQNKNRGLQTTIILGGRMGLINRTDNQHIRTQEEIQPIFTGSVSDIVASPPGTYQQQRGTTAKLGPESTSAKPVSDADIKSILIKKAGNKDNTPPGNRTISRDEINQMPY